ncbi:FliA/WhiG family RNA polymerase sigma factor [bacterium]|nr:MAG: FliA/WhiG family RNA polymerase sigma factor [bacterium]
MARDSLIRHYAYLVRVVVGRLVPGGKSRLEVDDLVGSGIAGLIRAVDTYDPAREVKFETYATANIRGAVLEAIRNEDFLPRSIRDRLRAFDRASLATEVRIGRPATDHELANELGVTEEHVGRLRIAAVASRVGSLDDSTSGSEGDTLRFGDMVADPSVDLDRELQDNEVREALTNALGHLPERERTVVGLYYTENLTFLEIGRVLGISESRAYQLHGQALSRLRQRFRPMLMAA